MKNFTELICMIYKKQGPEPEEYTLRGSLQILSLWAWQALLKFVVRPW